MLLIAATGMWLDVRYRRLPNWLCAVTLIAGIALASTSGAAIVQGQILHAAIALVLGIALFAMGWIGGGDAKYYAALAAWFPLSDAPLLLIAVSLAGFGLLVAWFALGGRRRKRRTVSSLSADDDAVFGSLPFGVAISVGALAAFWLTRVGG